MNVLTGVVLLSKGFIKPYSEFAKLQDTSKFTIIPNGLSFYLSAHYEDLTKHKVVLIVSRLDETQKKTIIGITHLEEGQAKSCGRWLGDEDCRSWWGLRAM